MNHNDIPPREVKPWADAIGPVIRRESVAESDDKLVVLTTSDGMKVCPVGQFVESIDEDGKQSYEVSPYVIFGWHLTDFSEMGEWSRAGGFFYPRQGQERSYAAVLTDPDVSGEDKQKLLKELYEDELERLKWTGMQDEFEAKYRILAGVSGLLGNELGKSDWSEI